MTVLLVHTSNAQIVQLARNQIRERTIINKRVRTSNVLRELTKRHVKNAHTKHLVRNAVMKHLAKSVAIVLQLKTTILHQEAKAREVVAITVVVAEVETVAVEAEINILT